jgi:hypothetical protein
MSEMKRTRLIQRLNKPVKRINPFSFGGGYKNGGMSDKAMDLVKVHFSFDYMGASEFEWGAVPEALAVLNEAKEKAAFSFEVKGEDIGQSRWGREKAVFPDVSTIYVVCNKDIKEGVEAKIRQILKDEQSADLKEATCLTYTLDTQKEDKRTCGWLELENGFFFFTDKEMWEGTSKLFGAA